jgi:hypothetical protein
LDKRTLVNLVIKASFRRRKSKRFAYHAMLGCLRLRWDNWSALNVCQVSIDLVILGTCLGMTKKLQLHVSTVQLDGQLKVELLGALRASWENSLLTKERRIAAAAWSVRIRILEDEQIVNNVQSIRTPTRRESHRVPIARHVQIEPRPTRFVDVPKNLRASAKPRSTAI